MDNITCFECDKELGPFDTGCTCKSCWEAYRGKNFIVLGTWDRYVTPEILGVYDSLRYAKERKTQVSEKFIFDHVIIKEVKINEDINYY